MVVAVDTDTVVDMVPGCDKNFSVDLVEQVRWRHRS
jgi:hypothetical protein